MAEPSFLPLPPIAGTGRSQVKVSQAVVWLLASRGNRITFKGLLLHLHPSISNSVRPAGLCIWVLLLGSLQTAEWERMHEVLASHIRTRGTWMPRVASQSLFLEPLPPVRAEVHLGP